MLKLEDSMSPTQLMIEPQYIFPYLEEVPKAVIIASLRPIIYLIGFLRTVIKYSNGIMMSAWINKPAITVAMYNPTIFRDSMMSSIATTFAAIKLQIPIGENLVTKTHSTIYYTSLMLNTLT